MRDHVDGVRSGEPEITVAPEFPSLQARLSLLRVLTKNIFSINLCPAFKFSFGSFCVEFRAKMDAYIGAVSIRSWLWHNMRLFAHESTKATYEWVGVARYCLYDFMMTQKQTQGLIINSLTNSFHSTLIKPAAILNLELGVVEVPRTFWKPKFQLGTSNP